MYDELISKLLIVALFIFIANEFWGLYIKAKLLFK